MISNKRTTIPDYIMSICRDMNPKILVVREYMINSKSKNPEDKKRLKDILENNNYFKTEDELLKYYAYKTIQINNHWKSLKEIEKIEAFTNDDSCKVIFGDIIRNDNISK